MIKKAVKRPDEVEYIEFKGRENFEEVCEFTGKSLTLSTKVTGEEYIIVKGDKPENDVFIDKDTIIYKWDNWGAQVSVYGFTEWDVMNKDAFFRRYEED